MRAGGPSVAAIAASRGRKSIANWRGADVVRDRNGGQCLCDFSSVVALDVAGDRGLVLATPIGIVTSMPTRLGWLFATPEDNIPPTVLVRASELAASAPVAMAGALADLRENPELLRRHLKALVPRPRKSGTIDVDLAVARARMEKSDTF